MPDTLRYGKHGYAASAAEFSPSGMTPSECNITHSRVAHSFRLDAVFTQADAVTHFKLTYVRNMLRFQVLTAATMKMALF